MKFIYKLQRTWAKLRLQPIRVFCFHQVSDTFDESTMKHCDWLQTDVFKRILCDMLQKGYIFISLAEAREKMQRDIFRCKKYVVLTADDGWASLKNVLPWLNEQQIPVTLFLNPAYLDGKHFREKETEKYLNETEVAHLYEQYPLVTIGMHGWEHKEATQQSEDEFRESVKKSYTYLSILPNFVPYFAYPWGRRSEQTNAILIERSIVPVTIRGGLNYDGHQIIDREVLDEKLKY